VAGRPTPLVRPLAPAPWPWWGFGLHVFVPIGPGPAPWAGPTPAPPTLESRLSGRGWFDGDEVELSAELRDRPTGTVILSRALRQGADPRDPRALRAMVDELLRDQPYAWPPPPGPGAVRPADGPAEPVRALPPVETALR